MWSTLSSGTRAPPVSRRAMPRWRPQDLACTLTVHSHPHRLRTPVVCLRFRRAERAAACRVQLLVGFLLLTWQTISTYCQARPFVMYFSGPRLLIGLCQHSGLLIGLGVIDGACGY